MNCLTSSSVSTEYQHVIVWDGLHGSIPIALVLSLRPDQYPSLPVAELRAMVFGVAAFSLIVQGLTMSSLLDGLGVVTRSEVEEVYELLLGRAQAVEAALDAVDQLHRDSDIPTAIYEAFTTEYERETEQLQAVISTLRSEHPELEREQLLMGERRVLQEEKSAVQDAIRTGVVSDDVGERLLEETDLKFDRVAVDESTVIDGREGYDEFWHERVRALGIAVDEPDGDMREETMDEKRE